MSRACGQPRGPSPGPHATCLHHLGCLKAVSSTLVSVRSLCPAVSCRSISLCVRPLPRHRCPRGCSRLVSGLSLSIDLRPIHPNLVQSRSSLCDRHVPLSQYPVGCSRPLPGRFIAAGVRSVRLGWRPAVPSLLVSGMSLAACFRHILRAWFP